MTKKSTTPYEKNVAARLLHYRNQIGMTRVEMGKSLEVSQQQISKYETGTNHINIGIFAKMCAIIGVTCGSVLDDPHNPVGMHLKQQRHLTTLFKDITALSPKNIKLLRVYVAALSNQDALPE